MLVLAQSSAHVPPNAIVAVLLFGAAIGIFGHIIKSRLLIVTGILIIGLFSAFFSFVLQPTG